MPEGHSIHRLARQFTDVFAGRRLRVSSPQGRFDAGARLLDGATLVAARAHGKQLFLDFGEGPGAAAERVLRVHLGLYGAWSFGGDETFRGASSIGAPRRMGETDAFPEPDGGAAPAYAGPPEPVGQVRARLVSAHGWADLRGPTACEVLTPAEAAAVVGRLGPDPLVPGTGPEEFLARVCRRSVALGQLLMDQAVLAGVGNIYRAEALFRAGLDPWLPGRRLGPDAGARLWEDIAELMADGVRAGRIITTRPRHRGAVDAHGVPAPLWPDNAHYVYQREGLDCRVCGEPVRAAQLQSRTLFWCPRCQAPGSDGAPG
ncbi:Fpg/Nei family DNA glycosylase [Citricoccus sp. SGAir0253]|uniref:Fpg/Nei family DNA glycosylase n=1 Tax=Citricoccus sp. SGAir0253 TaxID=2567881 RepID=UPI0010CD066F|nr:DNA-formamidopyrimidine glycosylase family protein [Citricoccus sp. SGAir0253]QCU78281.1 Fpg/Nei family DNA glycosylase [Citricoccus sp. SGAir0253]